MRIKKELENNYCNLVFNTNPIKVKVYYEILHPPDEARRIEEEHYEERRRRGQAWAVERERKEALERIKNQINEDQTFKSDECVICLLIHLMLCFAIAGIYAYA